MFFSSTMPVYVLSRQPLVKWYVPLTSWVFPVVRLYCGHESSLTPVIFEAFPFSTYLVILSLSVTRPVKSDFTFPLITNQLFSPFSAKPLYVLLTFSFVTSFHSSPSKITSKLFLSTLPLTNEYQPSNVTVWPSDILCVKLLTLYRPL